jgi:hypothetical protein
MYAALMGKLNLDQYNGILNGLQSIKAIQVDSAHWVSRAPNYADVITRFNTLLEHLKAGAR